MIDIRLQENISSGSNQCSCILYVPDFKLYCRGDESKMMDTLDDAQYNALLEHYRATYKDVSFIDDQRTSLDSSPDLPAKLYCRNSVRKAASISMDGLEYRSLRSGNKGSSQTGAYVQASFKGECGEAVGLYPGVIMFFFDHYLFPSGGGRIIHHLCFCRWFQKAGGSPNMVDDTFHTVEV
ncbi:hypothetical protein MBANPS3_006836 [Mucor bainieri]